MSAAVALDFPDSHYSPEIGRFLSQDPIGLQGGDTNFFRYVKNNPVNRIDPLGLMQLHGDEGATHVPEPAVFISIRGAGGTLGVGESSKVYYSKEHFLGGWEKGVGVGVEVGVSISGGYSSDINNLKGISVNASYGYGSASISSNSISVGVGVGFGGSVTHTTPKTQCGGN